MLRTLRRHLRLAGDPGSRVISGYRRPLGHEALTVGSSTAVGMSVTLPGTSVTAPGGYTYNFCIVQNPHATINALWRDDGVDPTTTVGMLLVAGAVLEYSGDLAKIRFIAASSEITLNVSKYA